MHEEQGQPVGGGGGGGGALAEALPQVESPSTVPLAANPRTADFRCAKSERIAGFFANECPVLVAQNYCKVFVLPDPDDADRILGYYTLSPSLLMRAKAINRDQRRMPDGLPIPMMLIGFMGRDDAAPAGLGKALLVDAARRVHRNEDLAAWGLMLDSEGGPNNEKLWGWYKAQGFSETRPAKDAPVSGVLYAALWRLIPELAR